MRRVRKLSDRRIDPSQFAEALIGIFDEYGESVMKGTKKAVDQTMKEMVKETKDTAPKKAILGRPAGTFANHISSKKGVDSTHAYSKVWYVRSPEYRLAHLLNNGHALRQGGRWEGTNFITNASRTSAEVFERRVKEAIQNAGR